MESNGQNLSPTYQQTREDIMNKIALGRLFKKMEDQEGHKMFVVGDTVPTDAASGYAKGCIFIDTDGGVGTVFYVNEGSETSCDFNAMGAA